MEISSELLELLEYLTPDEQAELDSLLLAQEEESALDDPITWIETNFFIPELNGPIVLADYQKQALKEALSLDEQGRFNYSAILWSDIKKSAKSTITAAVALWRAHCVSWGQIVIVANDLKQAYSRVWYYIDRAIKLNPAMRDKIKISGYKIILPNNTKIEAIPIDPTGEAGGNADMVVFSELWGAHSKAQQRMWTEATISPTKFGYSFRWIETYAGFTNESILLEQLYNTGVLAGKELWPDSEVYVNRPARMISLWNTRPRLAWQSAEYYEQEAAMLTPPEFDRVHRNKWASSLNKFVPSEWVDACKIPNMPEFDQYEPIVAAIDAGTSSDCFGIVGVSAMYREWVNSKGETGYTKQFIVRFVYLWTPQPGAKLEFSDPPSGPRDPLWPAPETIIRRLSKNLHIVTWVYDPYQLHNLCTNLSNDGVGYFSEMSQHGGGRRAKADKNLYDILRDRNLIFDGNRDLAEHVKNAAAKQEGEGLRLVKFSNQSKIDLAVCLSMACYQITELNLG